METFIIVLNQMLFLFLCMLIGFVLRKTGVMPDITDRILSKMEYYVFVPALTVNSFMEHCTPEALRSHLGSLGYAVLFLGLSIAAGAILAPFFTKDRGEIGIYRYAITVTNFGYMGNSLILGLFGSQMLFHYLIYTLPLHVFSASLAIVWLTAGKRKFSLRMLISPMFLSMLVGIALGLTGFQLPSFVQKTVSGCAGCFSPIAMILTGFVIAGYRFRDLLKKKNVYALTALRLVVLPLAIFGLCLLLRVPAQIRILVLVSSAMPLGLNTIVFPAAYGLDETPGATMALISNLVGLVTVPLILQLVL